MKKRLVSMLLVLTMVFALAIPVVGIEPFGGNGEYFVQNEEELRAALSSDSLSANIIISLLDSFNVSGDTLFVPGGRIVTINGGGNQLTFTRNMVDVPLFAVDGELILNDVTLNGNGLRRAGRRGVLVNSSGTLVMEAGAVIQNFNVHNSVGGFNDSALALVYDGSGSAVAVAAGATFNMYGGSIIDNTAFQGSVLVIGTFNMHGGIIANNNATAGSMFFGGGGVKVWNGGVINMYGGEISHNTANRHGGGIYLVNGTLNMSGGTISNNNANIGGGVTADWHSTIIMSGGYVHSNTARVLGAGVNIERHAVFTMLDGEINDNHVLEGAAHQGGGGVFVQNYTTFIMHGGLIHGNSADVAGGVRVHSGNFIMYGGTISENIARGRGADVNFGNGGGVHVREGVGTHVSVPNVEANTFVMHGGTIIGNTAALHGGGVWVGNNDISARFDMLGGTISDNTAVNGGGVFTARSANPNDQNVLEPNTYRNITIAAGSTFEGNVATSGRFVPPQENANAHWHPFRQLLTNDDVNFAGVIYSPPAVPQAPVITYYGPFTVRVDENTTLTLEAVGCYPLPITWELVSGTVPIGMTLNPDGTITGTPTVDDTFSFVVIARNDAGPSVAETVVVHVLMPPTILGPNPPSVGLNVPAAPFPFDAVGSPVLVWSYVGPLPNGMTFIDGMLAGTPTQEGSFPITVTVTNEVGSDSRTFTLVVGVLPVVTSTEATAESGVWFEYALQAASPSPIIDWTHVSGPLPAGLFFNPATGDISGFTTDVGIFPIVVTATNHVGTSAQATFNLAVEAMNPYKPVLPEPPGDGIIRFQRALPIMHQLEATGATPMTWTIVGSVPLPPGLLLNSTTGVITGRAMFAGTTVVRIRVQNNFGWYERDFRIIVM